MTKEYDDIIHLPHHVSGKHPRMAAGDRAAQFSPFAALTGHSAAVKETARLTDARAELDENAKTGLDNRLQILADRLEEHPEIEVTYFQPDARKTGGAYIMAVGPVKKIDAYKRVVVMTDGTAIPVDEIVGIDGRIFETMLHYE